MTSLSAIRRELHLILCRQSLWTWHISNHLRRESLMTLYKTWCLIPPWRLVTMMTMSMRLKPVRTLRQPFSLNLQKGFNEPTSIPNRRGPCEAVVTRVEHRLFILKPPMSFQYMCPVRGSSSRASPFLSPKRAAAGISPLNAADRSC